MRTGARPGTRAYELQRNLPRTLGGSHSRRSRGPHLVALVIALVLLTLPVTLTIVFGASGRL